MFAMSSTLEPRTTTRVPAGAVPREVHRLLLDAGFQPRQVSALSARLGLAGQGSLTLAEAGQTVGYTRERVRQLEDRLRLSAADEPLFPAATKAVRLADRTAPALASQVAAKLAQAGLLPRGFKVSGLLRIADVLGIEHDLGEYGAALVRRGDSETVQKVVMTGRRLVRADGVGTVGKMTQLLQLETASVRRLLALHADVVWLDRSRDLFFVRGTRSKAEGAVRKMLSISRTLSIVELQDGLRRAPARIDIPLHVLANLCAAFPWLVADPARRSVTLKVALDPNSTHSPIELKILRIFTEYGPRLEAAEVAAHGERLGLGRMTIRAYLTQMPSLERLARGRYALRDGGTEVSL
jgi:hypothetical protein